jgi:hypothetical protein
LRTPIPIAILLLPIAVAACAKKPAVTVEQRYDDGEERSSEIRVFAPRCGELPTARYPDLPPADRPDQVDVQVDLTLDENGNPGEVRATVLSRIEHPAPFIKAAETAAYMLHCEPAYRTPRPDSDELALVPIRYQTSMVFHFYRDEREAPVTVRSD